MQTYQTKYFPISEKVFKRNITKLIEEKISILENNLQNALDISFVQYKKRWFESKNYIVDLDHEVIYPKYDQKYYFKLKDFSKEVFLEQENYFDSNPELLDKKSMVELGVYEYYEKKQIGRNLEIINFIYITKKNQPVLFSLTKDEYYHLNIDEIPIKIPILTDDETPFYALPVTRKSGLSKIYFISFLRDYILKYELYPYYKSHDFRTIFQQMNAIYDYIVFETDSKVKIDREKLLEDIMNERISFETKKTIFGDIFNVLEEFLNTKTFDPMAVNDTDIVQKMNLDVKTHLLNCEKIRSDIDPYDERILTDPNRGHWDLWNEDENAYKMALEENLIARDPRLDINENGVIAIDFGTKSTVVVYQNNIDHSLPMGIGDGRLSKGPTIERYENPTVMHFVNLEKFLNTYNSKAGRPHTKWEDLTISHTAVSQFDNSKSDEYYEYLRGIKQWAGNNKKQLKIQYKPNEFKTLPEFMLLKENDLDPIELYAYYIGLYINNMISGHGIFLDYYLSFPVTYEPDVRKKILQSFERGLKKSFPETILNDESIMSKFKINGDISEPLAYAVCALQEYGFDPEEEEEGYFYGIFDFGGGTTDFDFGIWSKSQKRRYDYKIENFGANGNEFLGGENLLEMLAFEIFKNNHDMMRLGKYNFRLAPKSTEFIGSDSLLSDSMEAEKNMHNLMEKLRPYWEKTNPSFMDDLIKKKSNFIMEYCEQIIAMEEELENNTNLYQSLEEMINLVSETVDYERLEELKNQIDELIEKSKIKTEIKYNDEIKLVVSLFDKTGMDHPNESLLTSLTEIESFFEDKIREGIKSFFSSLLLSYASNKASKINKINIFLAGNSSKSSLVKKIFNEQIKLYELKIKQEYKDSYLSGENSESMFEIFPPLGTQEAFDKMRERGLVKEENSFERPTGKTGVAFGLINCRNGGNIEIIRNQGNQEELIFKYFLGYKSKKKFLVFKPENKLTKYKGKIDYNVWYKFIEADEATFYIYSTSLPDCIENNLIIEGNASVKMHKCQIDHVDEDAFVYIRAISSTAIEYVVSKDDDIEKSKIGEIKVKELE